MGRLIEQQAPPRILDTEPPAIQDPPNDRLNDIRAPGERVQLSLSAEREMYVRESNENFFMHHMRGPIPSEMPYRL